MWPFKNYKTSNSDEALRHRIVRLDGEIAEATAEKSIAWLLFLQHEDDQRPVTLLIQSEGGSVVGGMAIVNTIQELRMPVRTQAPVMAHGIAAIVLASGSRGERVVGPSAKLSLTPLESPVASSADIRHIHSRYQLAGVVADLCGQPSELVAQHLLTGLLFTPADAIAYGLADRIGK